MKQLSNINDIKKLLAEIESEYFLYRKSVVSMLEILPLKKKLLAKLQLVNVDINCNLTKKMWLKSKNITRW